MVSRYQKRISGPLMDRIDIHVEVPRVEFEKLSGKRAWEKSTVVREQCKGCGRSNANVVPVRNCKSASQPTAILILARNLPSRKLRE